jgi:hypothetical protein
MCLLCLIDSAYPCVFVWVFSLFDFADEAKAAVGIPADLVVPPFAVVASNRFDEVQPATRMEDNTSTRRRLVNVKPASPEHDLVSPPSYGFSNLLE